MKPTKLSRENYIKACLGLWAKGWYPCGDYESQSMHFLRNGKIYDLSAADLTKLDLIEEKGLFLV